MRIRSLVDEDFTNYKKPSMFIGTVSCGGKCCTEANIPLSVCQNDEWRKSAIVVMDDRKICERYLTNQITQAIVVGGLEPFEQFDELVDFMWMLRSYCKCNDDVVIYTGYYPEELIEQIECLKHFFKNVVVKFGRFIPDQKSRYDDVLGITLASDNQWGEKIC